MSRSGHGNAGLDRVPGGEGIPIAHHDRQGAAPDHASRTGDGGTRVVGAGYLERDSSISP